MEEKLLPCPFCGGEAEFEVYGGTACAVVCQSCQCGASTVCLDDGMQAVEAWNRRADRTCHAVDEECTWECDRCGYVGDSTTHGYSFCPGCGARVVD